MKGGREGSKEMPGLLSIIRKTKTKEKQLRVLMVGLDNAGKTTVVKKLAGESTDAVPPTLGFNIRTLPYREYTLNVWDVGGQKTLRPYWRNYFEETEALVWVVDSSDQRRLNDCAHELHLLLGEEKLAGSSLLVFANKQDVAGALSVQHIAQVLALESIGNRHWRIVPCSAVNGDGLHEGFDWVVQDAGHRLYLLQ